MIYMWPSIVNISLNKAVAILKKIFYCVYFMVWPNVSIFFWLTISINKYVWVGFFIYFFIAPGRSCFRHSFPSSLLQNMIILIIITRNGRTFLTSLRIGHDCRWQWFISSTVCKEDRKCVSWWVRKKKIIFSVIE